LSHDALIDIHRTRDLVSSTLKHIPNPSRRSVDEIWKEIEHSVWNCEWFRIYDLIEEIYKLRQWIIQEDADVFAAEVNDFLESQNITWQLKTIKLEGLPLRVPEIVIRGSEVFEVSVATAADVLATTGHVDAQRELQEAIADLSRRPHPDLTGSVHHAMAALECVAASVCGETGQTLGQIVKRHPDRFPAPLGDAVGKLYGFASDRGRHVTEGRMPGQKETELIVFIAAAVATYLSREDPRQL
jgi:hypothetical protein